MSATQKTPSQRIHIVRSAQKLGSIFGATPHVVGSLASPDDLSSDTSSFLSTNSASTQNSFVRRAKLFWSGTGHSTLHRGKASPTDPILLPLNTIPVIMHCDADDDSPPSSPSSSYSAEYTPPSTIAAHARRRQLAKVTRTLGENVPPELFFGIPSSHTTCANDATIGRRRGKSLSIAGNTKTGSSPSPSSRRRPSTDISKMPLDMPFRNLSCQASEHSESYYSTACRGEDDWEGAWNRQSMSEIRSKLRELRA